MHAIALVDDGGHAAQVWQRLARICQLLLLLADLLQTTHVLGRGNGQDDLGATFVCVADGL